MHIRFVYSAASPMPAGSTIQRHSLQQDIEVQGEANAYGDPSYKQLAEAERLFLAWFLTARPGDKLLKFETVPADGTVGRFSEYRAFLTAN